MIIEGNSYRYYFLCPETYEDIVLQYHCDRSKAIDFGLSFVIFANNKVSTIRTKCALEFIARPYLNSGKCDWKCMFSLREIMNNVEILSLYMRFSSDCYSFLIMNRGEFNKEKVTIKSLFIVRDVFFKMSLDILLILKLSKMKSNSLGFFNPSLFLSFEERKKFGLFVCFYH